MLTRTMPEDVVVKVKHPIETTMVLKKDSLIIIDMIALRKLRLASTRLQRPNDRTRSRS